MNSFIVPTSPPLASTRQHTSAYFSISLIAPTSPPLAREVRMIASQGAHETALCLLKTVHLPSFSTAKMRGLIGLQKCCGSAQRCLSLISVALVSEMTGPGDLQECCHSAQRCLTSISTDCGVPREHCSCGAAACPIEPLIYCTNQAVSCSPWRCSCILSSHPVLLQSTSLSAAQRFGNRQAFTTVETYVWIATPQIPNRSSGANNLRKSTSSFRPHTPVA